MQGSRLWLAVFVLLVLLAVRFTAAGDQANSSDARTRLKSLYFPKANDSWVLLSASGNPSAVVRISLAFAPHRDTGRLLYVVEKDVPPEDAAVIGVQFDSLFRPELFISAPREGIHKSITLDVPPTASKWYDFHIFYNFTANSAGNVSFSVDGSSARKSVSAEGVSHLLRGGGDFYLGGLPSAYFRVPSNEPDFAKWMRFYIIDTPSSFEGCMYPPEIQYSDGYSEKPGVEGGQHWLVNACGEVGNECSPLDPASCGAGVCLEDYDGVWKCDCRETLQSGKDCAMSAAVVPFYGNQGFIVRHDAAAPLNFDISLYFKSALPSGMILYLVDLSNRSKVALYIEEGRLVLEVQLQGNQSEVEHTIAPSWPVETEVWYFVHITGGRDKVMLRLDEQVVSTSVSLPERLFLDHAEVTLGDNDMATAPQDFKGCMMNIYFGIQRPADVSIIAVDICPDTEDLDIVPSSGSDSPSGSIPSVDFLLSIHAKLGHKVQLTGTYSEVNITFGWLGYGNTGTIAVGLYHDNTAFTLSMFNGHPVLQWNTVLGESSYLYTQRIDGTNWCNITVLKNGSHFGLVVQQEDKHSTSFDVIPALELMMEFNAISFGGREQSVTGLIHDLRVNGYNPITWMTIRRPDDSGFNATSSPTPQPSSSSAISVSSVLSSLEVNTVTSTDSRSSGSGSTSMVDGESTKSTTTASTHVHEASSPTSTGGVDTPPSSLVDHKTIDVTMLAATIFVAIVVVLTIVVVVIILLVSVFMFHCWQPCDSQGTKIELCEPEKGFEKETPLKMG